MERENEDGEEDALFLYLDGWIPMNRRHCKGRCSAALQ
jgi:hypothetical protein